MFCFSLLLWFFLLFFLSNMWNTISGTCLYVLGVEVQVVGDFGDVYCSVVGHSFFLLWHMHDFFDWFLFIVGPDLQNERNKKEEQINNCNRCWKWRKICITAVELNKGLQLHLEYETLLTHFQESQLCVVPPRFLFYKWLANLAEIQSNVGIGWQCHIFSSIWSCIYMKLWPNAKEINLVWCLKYRLIKSCQLQETAYR